MVLENGVDGHEVRVLGSIGGLVDCSFKAFNVGREYWATTLWISQHSFSYATKEKVEVRIGQ